MAVRAVVGVVVDVGDSAVVEVAVGVWLGSWLAWLLDW